MIDYARVAQLLKEVDSFIDTDDAPRLHSEYVEALTAAAALCEAHAAPVDEAKERAEFEDEFPCAEPTGDEHYPYRGDIAHAQWCAWQAARARTDARARVADWQPIESAPKDCTMVLVPIGESSTMAFYVQSQGVWKDCDGEVMEPQPKYFMYLPSAPPPPTIEGERR